MSAAEYLQMEKQATQINPNAPDYYEQVIEIANSDPDLATRVIGSANSAAYGTFDVVDTVPRAIARIGSAPSTMSRCSAKTIRTAMKPRRRHQGMASSGDSQTARSRPAFMVVSERQSDFFQSDCPAMA